MENQVVLMTGATSGFGKLVAHHIVQQPCTFILFGRSELKNNSVINELNGLKHPETKLQSLLCDLCSFQSVKLACDKVNSDIDRIDLMLLNAGIMKFKFHETDDGIEETLQVNLLSHMLIVSELEHLIPRNGKSKIILTASGLHQGRIQFDNINFRGKFSSYRTYRQAKLGVILMVRLLAQMDKFNDVKIVAAHPGMVRTGMGRNASWLSRLIFYLMGKSVEEGAQTHIKLIDADNNDLDSGAFYSPKGKDVDTTRESFDMGMAEKLYEFIQKTLEAHL